MAKSFNELRKNIPQHVQDEACKKTEAMLYQLTLAEVRESRKITQNELAGRMNINQAAVSKLENRAGISLTKLQKMVEAMGGELDIIVKFPDKEFTIQNITCHA